LIYYNPFLDIIKAVKLAYVTFPDSNIVFAVSENPIDYITEAPIPT